MTPGQEDLRAVARTPFPVRGDVDLGRSGVKSPCAVLSDGAHGGTDFSDSVGTAPRDPRSQWDHPVGC